MSSDIYQLDKIDPESSRAEGALEKFRDTVMNGFFDSPEGRARRQIDPDMGFWTAQLIDYGFSYIGVTLPKMTVREVRELLVDIFPRKISILSPDDADDAIPELVAFWQYLKREYKLANAEPILSFFKQIDHEFKKAMNDPSKFGMAKSFVMLGQSMGYDMTNEKGLHEFMLDYNARLLQQERSQEPFPEEGDAFELTSDRSGFSNRKASPKSKNRRKMEKLSRKKNRKKRK
jgi:hypothetical protein